MSPQDIVFRMQEINGFVSQQMSDPSVLGRNELKKQYSSLLKEVIGWYDNPNNSICSYNRDSVDSQNLNRSEKINHNTTDILDQLDDLLLPNVAGNLITFALETRRDTQTEFLFPVEALPKHTQHMLQNRMYDSKLFGGNYLTVPLHEQLKSIESCNHIILNSWEFFLFTFFSKISRIQDKSQVNILSISVTKYFSNSNSLVEDLAMNYELYLFSKYYLYTFEESKYSNE